MRSAATARAAADAPSAGNVGTCAVPPAASAGGAARLELEAPREAPEGEGAATGSERAGGEGAAPGGEEALRGGEGALPGGEGALPGGEEALPGGEDRARRRVARRSLSARPAEGSEFGALLEPLARLTPAPRTPHRPRLRRPSLLRPSADGRRRPLLGLRTLRDASELAPFARALHAHLGASAVLPRAAELDTPLVELLLGCEFLPPAEVAPLLKPHLLPADVLPYSAGRGGP